MADIGDPDGEEDVKKLPLLFPAARLNLDKVRVGFSRIVDAISDIDLFGGFGIDTPSVGRLGTLPLFARIIESFASANATSVSLVDAVVDLGSTLRPVGSSRPRTPISYVPTSLTNTPKICCGRSLAMVAYSSRSCSPVSPMRMNRESRKLSRISRMPARLRVAGAERRPLKRERPAYDFRRTEPGRMAMSLHCAFENDRLPYLVVISKPQRTR